jgi:8-oxo-dGTP pyrophosphatase MutT (NUDIX family)
MVFLLCGVRRERWRIGRCGRAARELREELSLEVDPSQLELEIDVTHDWEGRRDHVVIFDLHLDHAPRVKVDNREVVAAEFLTPEQALTRKLFPPLRRHVEAALAG